MCVCMFKKGLDIAVVARWRAGHCGSSSHGRPGAHCRQNASVCLSARHIQPPLVPRARAPPPLGCPGLSLGIPTRGLRGFLGVRGRASEDAARGKRDGKRDR